MSEDKYERALKGIQEATQKMRENTERMRVNNESALRGLDNTLLVGELSHKATSFM